MFAGGKLGMIFGLVNALTGWLRGLCSGGGTGRDSFKPAMHYALPGKHMGEHVCLQPPQVNSRVSIKKDSSA